MRRFLCAALVVAVVVSAAPAWAQDAAAAVEQQAEALRAQLRAVTEQEAGLQARLRQLEEDLEPQNVERSVAAIGTTDARALRDERRQQLERQKAGVEQQLASLAASRARLESAISTAEAEAVRLRANALGTANAPQPSTPAPTAATTPAASPAPARKKAAAPRKARTRKRSRPRRRT